MRLVNPYYVKPAGPLDTFEMQINAWFTENPDVGTVSFDQLRDFFGKTKQQWPDGEIHKQLMLWGYDVVAG